MSTKTINGKTINWTPTGYATYLPSGDKPYMFLECNIPSLTQNKTQVKTIGPLHTGYATHLSSGDKTFSRFQKLEKPNEFLKIHYTVTKTNNVYRGYHLNSPNEHA